MLSLHAGVFGVGMMLGAELTLVLVASVDPHLHRMSCAWRRLAKIQQI